VPFELPFSSKTPPLIGLDIGSSSVKLVELTQSLGGNLRLERYAMATSTRSMSWPKPFVAPIAAPSAGSRTLRWPCRRLR
jgi:hypothetical protein